MDKLRSRTGTAVLTSYSSKTSKTSNERSRARQQLRYGGSTSAPPFLHAVSRSSRQTCAVVDETVSPLDPPPRLRCKGFVYLTGTFKSGDDVGERCRRRGSTCYQQVHIISSVSRSAIGPYQRKEAMSSWPNEPGGNTRSKVAIPRISGRHPLPKRQRVARACDACRQIKLKCNGNRPSCEYCLTIGSPCLYSASKREVRQISVQRLEERIQDYESALGEVLLHCPSKNFRTVLELISVSLFVDSFESRWERWPTVIGIGASSGIPRGSTAVSTTASKPS